jgi:hypothetical protein
VHLVGSALAGALEPDGTWARNMLLARGGTGHGSTESLIQLIQINHGLGLVSSNRVRLQTHVLAGLNRWHRRCVMAMIRNLGLRVGLCRSLRTQVGTRQSFICRLLSRSNSA